MPYIAQSDLENALSPQTVAALYDDQNVGSAYAPAITAVLTRASTMVDSYLARVFQGPFPVPQLPVPQAIVDATLEFAIVMSFERHPDYVRTFGEEQRSGSRWKRAIDLMERICDGLQEIPDWNLQPKAGNIGGVIYSAGPRTIVDNTDGTSNTGDF